MCVCDTELGISQKQGRSGDNGAQEAVEQPRDPASIKEILAQNSAAARPRCRFPRRSGTRLLFPFPFHPLQQSGRRPRRRLCRLELSKRITVLTSHCLLLFLLLRSI
jgi:hypothetical protein